MGGVEYAAREHDPLWQGYVRIPDAVWLNFRGVPLWTERSHLQLLGQVTRIGLWFPTRAARFTTTPVWIVRLADSLWLDRGCIALTRDEDAAHQLARLLNTNDRDLDTGISLAGVDVAGPEVLPPLGPATPPPWSD